MHGKHKPLIFYVSAFSVLLVYVASPPTIESARSAEPDPTLLAMLQTAALEVEDEGDHFTAWVWLSDMSQRLKSRVRDNTERTLLLQNVYSQARRINVAPELVLAIIDVESNFDRYAISKSGARGLMQVMPFWLKEIGRTEDNLFNTTTNLRYGCTILRHYLNKEKGDTLRALARYNGSFGKKDYPEKVYRRWQSYWFRQ